MTKAKTQTQITAEAKTDELQGKLDEMSVETRTLAKAVEPKPSELTAQQQQTLSKLERKIEAAQRSFISIADALREVRDQKLYLSGYKSFRAYMGQRWEFDYATQTRMEDAIEVLTVLRKHEVEEKELPGNEGQARQLSRVLKAKGEEALVDVWQEVRDRGERISASLIVEVAGLPKSDSAAQQTAPPVKRFGKKLAAVITVDDNTTAELVAEKFAPNSERTPKGVSVGIDSADELALVLNAFDDNESSKEMTIRIVR